VRTNVSCSVTYAEMCPMTRLLAIGNSFATIDTKSAGIAKS